MSLLLPPAGTELRENLDMGFLASVGSDPSYFESLPTISQAYHSSVSYMATDKKINKVTMYIRVERELWLVDFDRDGGHSVLWKFGSI